MSEMVRDLKWTELRAKSILVRVFVVCCVCVRVCMCVCVFSHPVCAFTIR